MDHPQPRLERILGTAEPHLAAIDEDTPLIRLVKPHQDVHERRLAGSILTDKGQDLPLSY